MSRSELAFPAGILVVVVVMLALGNSYYQYPWMAFAFPLAVGIAVCVLCVIEIATALRGRQAAVRAGSDVESADDTQEPFSPKAAAWMFALVVFLYAFGFVFGAAAYLLVCLRTSGFSWIYSIVVALASILATWGLFIHILGILLPVEPLWMTP